MSKVIVIVRRVFACPNDFMGSRQSNLIPDEGGLLTNSWHTSSLASLGLAMTANCVKSVTYSL